jgi:hypothetical protein
MFLLELITAFACLTMLCVDLYLGMVVYEKYLTLPKLRHERNLFLDRAYRAVADLPAKRRKQVNDRIRRSSQKVVEVIHFPSRKKERKVA